MRFVLLSVVIFLFVFSGCQEEQSKQEMEQKVLQVDIVKIQKKPFPVWVRYTGRTKASNKQEVISRVSGILEKRYIKDGEFVKKGQKLFLIQQDEYKAALQSAKARLAKDKAALKLAQTNVKRYAPLVKDGLAPRATLESYEAKVAELQAVILGDLAKIKEAKLNLSYTLIKAPIDGKVSARRVDVGNMIEAKTNQILTTIVKIDPIYAYFSPSQQDVAMFYKISSRKKPYAFVELENAYETKRYNGYVDFLDNVVDPFTSTITMRAIVRNPNFDLLPGSFVYVNIFLTDKLSFIMIPPYVILNDQLGRYVYIVDKNNKVKRVDVKIGYKTKYYASIIDGLKDGDMVIVSSLAKIKEGVSVKINDVTQKEGIDAILKKNNLVPKQVD